MICLVFIKKKKESQTDTPKAPSIDSLSGRGSGLGMPGSGVPPAIAIKNSRQGEYRSRQKNNEKIQRNRSKQEANNQAMAAFIQNDIHRSEQNETNTKNNVEPHRWCKHTQTHAHTCTHTCATDNQFGWMTL